MFLSFNSDIIPQTAVVIMNMWVSRSLVLISPFNIPLFSAASREDDDHDDDVFKEAVFSFLLFSLFFSFSMRSSPTTSHIEKEELVKATQGVELWTVNSHFITAFFQRLSLSFSLPILF
jgi:hypothetical protein